MKVIELKVSQREVLSFSIEYKELVPSGNYLIFGVGGYSSTMRNPGIPDIIHDDGEDQLIRITYDMYESIGRGDNTYPRDGATVAYLVEIEDVATELVILRDSIKEIRKELEKPKRGRKPKKED